MSRVVNGLIPVVANATAGYVMLKFDYENLVLSVGLIYVLAAFVILFVDKNQYPSNLSDENQRVTMKDFFVNEGKRRMKFISEHLPSCVWEVPPRLSRYLIL